MHRSAAARDPATQPRQPAPRGLRRPAGRPRRGAAAAVGQPCQRTARKGAHPRAASAQCAQPAAPQPV
eukprot:5486705-Alexandrium_andersonii.AAC.1